MNRSHRWRIWIWSALLIAPTIPAMAHQATEIYIPIGNSPGLSSDETLIGTIQRVDYDERSLEVLGSDGPLKVSMNEKTRYFLDNSRRQQKSQLGTLLDCKVGYTVEIRFTLDGLAAWIKIDPQ